MQDGSCGQPKESDHCLLYEGTDTCEQCEKGYAVSFKTLKVPCKKVEEDKVITDCLSMIQDRDSEGNPFGPVYCKICDGTQTSPRLKECVPFTDPQFDKLCLWGSNEGFCLRCKDGYTFYTDSLSCKIQQSDGCMIKENTVRGEQCICNVYEGYSSLKEGLVCSKSS